MAGELYLSFLIHPIVIESLFYPFGPGLSYTDFEYANLKTNVQRISEGEEFTVSVEVTNTGEVSGDEVVQLYVGFPESKVKRPIKDLRGFDRIPLQPGETKTVEFTLSADDLRYWDSENGQWILEQSPVEIMVGTSSEDIREREILEVE